MAPGLRQLANEDQLYAAAVGALARRAHSSFEMRKFLERRAADGELVGRVVARLRGEGLLDDARYAALFVRSRSVNRRQGPLRIARELRARGVADRHIKEALETVSSPENEQAALRRRVQIWLRGHRATGAGGLDRKRFASLYRSLLRAGFSGDLIRAELRRLGDHPAGEPEIEAGDR